MGEVTVAWSGERERLFVAQTFIQVITLASDGNQAVALVEREQLNGDVVFQAGQGELPDRDQISSLRVHG